MRNIKWFPHFCPVHHHLIIILLEEALLNNHKINEPESLYVEIYQYILGIEA